MEQDLRPAPVTLCLPTRDRGAAHAFYRRLGLVPEGEPDQDGIPEPLQFVVDDGLRLMLVPTGGFGWVTAGRPTAEAGTSECLISVVRDSEREVDEFVERARAAGGQVVDPAGRQGWGYRGVFADPDGHLWQVLHAGAS